MFIFEFAWLAFQTGPGRASDRPPVSTFDVAQLQPRKEAPKGTQPATGAAPPATKASAPETCDPKTRKLDDVSAAINKGLQQIQKSCATKSSPAQFKLVGSHNLAVLVRPLTGDIDAFLSRNGEIIDVSMNTKGRVELILVPALGEFELVVSAESPVATFEISTLRPNQKDPQINRATPEQQKGTPRQAPVKQVPADNTNASSSNVVPGWVLGAFRDLGYDLIEPASSTDDSNNPVDQRAIMNFQAGERFAVTGSLQPEQIRYLANLAAAQLDVRALEILKTARQVSRASPVVIFPEPAADPDDNKDPVAKKDQVSKKKQMAQEKDDSAIPLGLKSMRGAFFNGRFFGEGVLRTGSKFEGEWLDGPIAGDSQRPALGVLFLANDCSATIKTFGMPGAGTEDVQLDEAGIIANSIGVLRKKGKMVFAGELAQANNELQSCMPPSSQN
jgi:hypothetical protein